MPEGLTVDQWVALVLKVTKESSDPDVRLLAGVLLDIITVTNDPSIGKVLDRWSSFLIEAGDRK